MDKDAIKKYLETDYANALEFYDKKAKEEKNYYRKFSVYTITASAVITPLIAFAPQDNIWIKIFTSALSATVVVGTSLLGFFKSHENWLSYRSSWDALKREHRLYETGAGAYKSETDKDTFFVEQIETILAKENAEFYARHIKADNQKAEKPTQSH